MGKHDVHFSHESVEWETPQAFFDELHKEFDFEFDACATPQNAKCAHYFTKEHDALAHPWHVYATRFFMNPPYGREIKHWVQKAFEESLVSCTVVCLLPARTDTAWFHEWCLPYAEIRYLRGRLKFGGAKNSAPFPSMLAIFKPPPVPLISYEGICSAMAKIRDRKGGGRR